MKLAMISCAKYSDAWPGFIGLLNHFWPDHPPLTLITDKVDAAARSCGEVFLYNRHGSWCEILASFARQQCLDTDLYGPVLLMQEDFFINASVRTDLIEHGIEQMEAMKAGCVRLYPCPGGDEDYGNPHYAIVPRGTRYRISCQASLFRPAYLYAIANRCGSTPADFEINGSELSDDLAGPVLAFKRDVQPWPMSYLCSAISRGQWNPAAKDLCDSLGIENDWSRRPFQAA